MPEYRVVRKESYGGRARHPQPYCVAARCAPSRGCGGRQLRGDLACVFGGGGGSLYFPSGLFNLALARTQATHPACRRRPRQLRLAVCVHCLSSHSAGFLIAASAYRRRREFSDGRRGGLAPFLVVPEARRPRLTHFGVSTRS
ncbi:hypothetical protein MRX96_042357 [Rhipicephalus microplus]